MPGTVVALSSGASATFFSLVASLNDIQAVSTHNRSVAAFFNPW
jgi:hypothetical protein